jgi:hypothetical protein
MTEPGSRTTAGLGPKPAGYATALRATLDGLERHEVR